MNTDLVAEVAALRAQLARLERRLEMTSAGRDNGGATPARSDRRGLMRLGAVGLAGAAVAAVSRPGTATAAACETPVYSDCTNGVEGPTTLFGGFDFPMFSADNTVTDSFASLAGPFGAVLARGREAPGAVASTQTGLYGVHGLRNATATTPSGTAGVFGEHLNTDTFGTGVIGKHHGAGWGMWATSASGKGIHADGGTGIGAEGVTTGTVANTFGVIGRVTGAKPAGGTAAVRGFGGSARGGVFSGARAQVSLVAGGLATHPASGNRGDLYVDSTGRLWFCKVSGNPATWSQVG